MSDLIPQALESFSHLPDGVEHPLDAAVVAACVAGALAVQGVRYHWSKEKYTAPSPNPALIEKAIKPNDTSARRSRMVPAYTGIAGVGLALATALAVPQYETAHPDQNANTVVVEDSSLSMLNTADLQGTSLSRMAVVRQAIASADYAGSLGVVQMGSDNKIAMPLSPKWHNETKSLNKKINPNGGNLVSAMDSAGSLFPPVASPKNSAHKDTLVVVTDGTVDDSGKEIADETAKLAKDGINVKFIIPGTKGGHYTLGTGMPPVESGVDTDRFSLVPQGVIQQPKTATEVTNTIHAEIHSAGITHDQHRWLALGAIGVILMGGAWIADQYQRPSRVV